MSDDDIDDSRASSDGENDRDDADHTERKRDEEGPGMEDVTDRRSAPMSDLADRVRSRRESSEEFPLDRSEAASRSSDDPSTLREEDAAVAQDPGESLEDDELFEPIDTDRVDEEAVWERLVSDPAESNDFGRVESEATPEATPDPTEAVETEVDKRSFCQRCEYFAEPPEVACDHDGTSIVEVVDRHHFRVLNCPMVEQGGPEGVPTVTGEERNIEGSGDRS